MRRMNRSAAKAYTAIRQKIVSAGYPAGAKLSAKHLAEEIGVSRTPVRDALRELEAEGLVVLTPRQEARVKSATLEEFRDLCDLRIALETHAAALAAERRTAEDLEAMGQTLEAMRGLVQAFSEAANKEESFGRLIQEDIRFHTAVIDAGGNRLLKDEVFRFQVIAKVLNPRVTENGGIKLNPCRNNPLDVWESHLKIYENIRRQRREEAREAMEEHLAQGIKVQLRARREAETTAMIPFI